MSVGAPILVLTGEERTVLKRGKKSWEDGNAAIETSLVLLPLLALLFAFFDYGLVIFLQSTFQHSVREGVRYAVTYQTSGGMGHDASIKEVVKENALGFLNDHDDEIKIRYFDPVTLQEVPDNSPGNIIEVSVEGYSYSWMAPLWRAAGTIAIQARASDRMEGLPTGASPPPR